MYRSTLTLTDKRLYGNASSGKPINLPLAQIASVSTGSFNRIKVTTTAGKSYRFWQLPDVIQAKNALSQQLNTLQKTPTQLTANDTLAQLQTYQQLLLQGVITQEEYEAKRKQILGL